MVQFPPTIIGDALTTDIIHIFENALLEFKEEFDPKSDKSKALLDEITQILTVSITNMQEVKDQKWFQRAWNTVSGKNKKLERINNQNLLKVQKGSIYFLQKFAQQNRLMMQSVYAALKRIEDIQIQNIKLKKYLFQIVDKYNEKINVIEERLNQHDEDIDRLKSATKVNWAIFVLGLILMGGAIILFITIKQNLITISGSAVLVVLGIMLLIKSIYQSDKKMSIIYESDQFEKGKAIVYQTTKAQRIKIQNDKIIPIIKENLIAYFLNDFMISELICYPIKPYSENYQQLLKIVESLNINNKIENTVIANVMDEIFKISPDVTQSIRANCSNFASQCILSINSFISETIKKMPNSIGIDLKTQLDFDECNILNDEVLSSIEPYFENLKEMEALRHSLLQDYPRYRKKLTENICLSYAKEFIKGAFIIPAIIDDTDDFVNLFVKNWEQYCDSWDNFYEISIKSINPLIGEKLYSFVRFAVNNMDPLFDGFANHEIELWPLNEELESVIREQNKELDKQD